MSTWEERAKLLQAESQRFQQYLTELPDDAWSKQSAKPSPAHQVGHQGYILFGHGILLPVIK